MGEARTMTVLLVRHGETTLNASGRIRGRSEADLDATGVEQARTAAAGLRDWGLDRVVTSPLRRAVHTGEIIAQACGVPRSEDPAFTDRDYGEWTEHVQSEVIARWGSLDAAPGVEPMEDVLARTTAGLEALAGAGRGETVAVVTHDVLIRLLLSWIQPGIHVESAPASWQQLEHGPDGWRVVATDQEGGDAVL